MLEELTETFTAMDKQDMVSIADGLADLLYVAFGTAVAYGLPMDKIFQEVYRSNMTKGKSKVMGKSVKGANYDPPNLLKVLFPPSRGQS